MKDGIADFINSILDTFDSLVDQVLTILSLDIFSGGNGYLDGMFSLAQSVKSVVMPIALTIITIIFLIEFLKTTMQMDILKWEYGLKVFFKFVFAKVAIDISSYLMSAIYATSAEWIGGIGSASSTLGATAGAIIKNEIQGYGTMKILGLVMTALIMFLVVIGCALLMNVIAYARIFEILIYVAISPLPCAFLPAENSRIPMKFFCGFAGVCLQGVFMAISIKMYVMLCNSILGNISADSSIWSVIYNLVIGSVVCLMAVIKSGQWANKVFDVA